MILCIAVSFMLFATDINECMTGDDNCHQDATCTDTDGGFTCECNSGYNDDDTDNPGTMCSSKSNSWILNFHLKNT